MRILALTNYAGDTIGGGETHLLRLMEGLRGRHEFLVGVPEGSEIARRVAAAGHEARAVKWDSAYRAIHDVEHICARDGIDLVHAHGYYPGIVARFGCMANHVPVVSTMHCAPDVQLEARDDLKTRIGVGFRGFVDDASAGLICRVIAVSEMVAECMRAQGFPARKLTVIHNGVPVEDIRAKAAASTFRLPDAPAGTRWIGTAARLEASKHITELVAALPLMPADVRCIIVGDGEERAPLEAQAASLGLGARCVFLGHSDDVPGILAALDAAVVPSPRGGLNVTMLEAMATGTPVIGIAAGAGEAIVDGVSGLLLPDSRPATIAAGVERLLADPALMTRLAEGGARRVEQEFSIETMVRRTEAVYEECARPGARS